MHFQCGAFFELFLDGEYLLFFGENGIGFHFFVFAKGCRNYVCYGTSFLFAEFLCFFKVFCCESCLDACYELHEACLTESGAKCEIAFNNEREVGEEAGEDDRHHETTFVHCTEKVALDRLVSGVAALEVLRITENEFVEAECYYEANHHYKPRCFHTFEACAFCCLWLWSSLRRLNCCFHL